MDYMPHQSRVIIDFHFRKKTMFRLIVAVFALIAIVKSKIT